MTIINSSAAIKKYVDTQDAKKVSKTGDTMTGNLTLVKNTGIFCVKGSTYDRDAPPSSGRAEVGAYWVNDKDNFNLSSVYTAIYPDGSVGVNLQSKNKNASGAEVRSIVSSIVKADGTTYATCPTPSAKNDNSTKIATTSWVNTASTVVHKTGNETIAGTKTFTSPTVVKQTANTAYAYRVASLITSRDTAPTANQSIDMMRVEDGSGLLCAGMGLDYKTTNVRNVHLTLRHKGANVFMGLTSNGTDIWGYAPTPLSSAKGTEIATAKWVNDKLSGVPTKTSISGPTVDQMVDAPLGAVLLMSYNDGRYEFVASLTNTGGSAWAGSGVAYDGIIYRSVLYASVTADSGVTLYCGVPMNGNFGVSTISVTPTDEGVTLVYVE